MRCYHAILKEHSSNIVAIMPANRQSYTYSPRPPLAMQVIPLAVSAAQMQAPEEVYEKKVRVRRATVAS